MRFLRRAVASLFVLILPKAALAAEAKSLALLPPLTLPPPALPTFSAFDSAPKELKWIGSLAFRPRRDTAGRILPTAAYDDRRMLCGKYCVPTYEMERGAIVARTVLFGVGAASIGTGLALALWPSDEPNALAPSFKFSMGKQRVSMSALWNF